MIPTEKSWCTFGKSTRTRFLLYIRILSNYVWSWCISYVISYLLFKTQALSFNLPNSKEQSFDLLKEVAIYLKCKVPKRMCSIQNPKFGFQSTLNLPFTHLLLLLISTSDKIKSFIFLFLNDPLDPKFCWLLNFDEKIALNFTGVFLLITANWFNSFENIFKAKM